MILSDELYQELILDHNRSPRNFGIIQCSHHAEGFNPMCGDRYKVYIQIENGIIRDISFDGIGCAISKASASIMTSLMKGQSVGDVEGLFATFKEVISGRNPVLEKDARDLAALAGLHKYPSRIKCATLSWHALKDALNEVHSSTTE